MIKEIVKIADRHNLERDSAIEYVSDIMSSFSKFSTVKNMEIVDEYFPECWVLERDEYGDACDYSGYVKVADLGMAVLCYPALINGERITKEELQEQWIQESQDGFQAEFYVFHTDDVYGTREEAKEMLVGMDGD